MSINEEMTVTHYNKDGEVIPDISKVDVPEHIQAEIFEILNPGKKAISDNEEKHADTENSGETNKSFKE